MRQPFLGKLGEMGRAALRPALVGFALAGAAPCFAQAVAPPAAAAPEPDPAALALARDVIELAFPPERRAAMFARVTEAMVTQSREAVRGMTSGSLDEGAQPILDRFLRRMLDEANRSVVANSAPLFAAMARAYARQFTLDELTQIRAFVATPAGAKYIQRSADLLADPDVAQANMEYTRRFMASIQPLREQLQRELTEYLQRHPPRR